MANHKFNKSEFDSRKVVKENLKTDANKKTTVSALADRVISIEKVLGVR